MALTTMKELLVTAQKEKYAVGAFEFWSLDSAQAIIHAAETENVPVINIFVSNPTDILLEFGRDMRFYLWKNDKWCPPEYFTSL